MQASVKNPCVSPRLTPIGPPRLSIVRALSEPLGQISAAECRPAVHKSLTARRLRGAPNSDSFQIDHRGHV